MFHEIRQIPSVYNKRGLLQKSDGCRGRFLSAYSRISTGTPDIVAENVSRSSSVSPGKFHGIMSIMPHSLQSRSIKINHSSVILPIPRGGGVEYLHCSPASRRR
jgi:hypothetical protein